MRMRRGSVVLVVAIGLWAVTTVGWLGLIAVERAFKSDMTCDLVEGGSDYGDATWSWFPPGSPPTCATVTTGSTRSRVR